MNTPVITPTRKPAPASAPVPNKINASLSTCTLELSKTQPGKELLTQISNSNLTHEKQLKLIDRLEENYKKDNSSIEIAYDCYKAIKNFVKKSNDALSILNYSLELESNNTAKLPEALRNNLYESVIVKSILDITNDKETLIKILGLANEYNLDKKNLLRFIKYFNSNIPNSLYDMFNLNKEKLETCFKNTLAYMVKICDVIENDNSIVASEIYNQKKAFFETLLETFNDVNVENIISYMKIGYKKNEILLNVNQLKLKYLVALKSFNYLIHQQPDYGIYQLHKLLTKNKVKGTYEYNTQTILRGEQKEITLEDLMRNCVDNQYHYYKTVEDASTYLREHGQEIVQNGVIEKDYVKKFLMKYLKGNVTLDNVSKMMDGLVHGTMQNEWSYERTQIQRPFYLKDVKEPYYKYLLKIHDMIPVEKKEKFLHKILKIITRQKTNRMKENDEQKLINSIVDKISSDNKIEFSSLSNNVLTLLAEKRAKISSDPELEKYGLMLKTLDNILKNSETKSFGLIMGIVEDFVTGKADDFLAKNYNQKNITIDDYIKHKMNNLNAVQRYKIKKFVQKNFNNENDAKESYYYLSTFAKEHRGKLYPLISKLNRMLKIDDSNRNQEEIPDKKSLIKSIMFEISHPFLITQYAGTCVATSIEFYLCKNKPFRYIDIIKDNYIDVVNGELEYDKSVVLSFSEEKYSAFLKQYPSLAFFQTINFIMYFGYYYDSLSKFTDFSLYDYNMIARHLDDKEMTKVNKLLDDKNEVFLIWNLSMFTNTSHQGVILSYNKDDAGNVVSYNVFHGQDIHDREGRVTKISVQELKNQLCFISYIKEKNVVQRFLETLKTLTSSEVADY